MTTRENILKTARALYNAKGTDAVTVRHIAAELGMSHGNLCYHFPNTNAIVRQLYLDLVAELDQLIAVAMQTPPQKLGIADMVQYTRAVFSIFYEYRFLMLDFARVMRSDQWMRDHYRQLITGRMETFRYFFGLMLQQKIIRPERVPGEYEMIIELQLVCGDFWLSRAETLRRMPREALIDFYVRVWLAPMPGLLTAKGLREWNTVFSGAQAALPSQSNINTP